MGPARAAGVYVVSKNAKAPGDVTLKEGTSARSARGHHDRPACADRGVHWDLRLGPKAERMALPDHPGSAGVAKLLQLQNKTGIRAIKKLS